MACRRGRPDDADIRVARSALDALDQAGAKAAETGEPASWPYLAGMLYQALADLIRKVEQDGA